VPAESNRSGHDIVVTGASAGGVEALGEIVAELPGDLAASMFVVLHIPPSGTSVLPVILMRRGELPASHAVDEEQIRHGHIYIAPPDPVRRRPAPHGLKEPCLRPRDVA
jgi:two-component system, chemotaxis family, protein-glutamate methylesterase/glutaminase